MDVIRFSIKNPVTVIVGVMLVVLFGFVSLQRIPIQLSPSVEEPEITVTTIWPGATPYEIERDIIEEQEKVLKGIPGLYEMEGIASNGRGQITLRFKIGTDIESALLRTSNKLNEVREYPENVDRPVINPSGAETSPIMWMMLRTAEDNPTNVYHYRTYLENDIRQYIERVDGVSELGIGGGSETQMQVLVKPEKLAAYGLTIDQILNALRGANSNVSAGNLGVGRHEFRVRSVAEFRSEQDIKDVVVVSDGLREVRVGDLADVAFGYEKLTVPVMSRGKPGIAMRISPEPNTNVLELTDSVEAVVNRLNEEILRPKGLYIEIVNEQRPYIRGAIQLLQQNILVGGALAITVLLTFLRSIAPTIVVSTAIPISVIGTFLFMWMAGSSLNVVSLAGIAFAVGMLVDNAIVVLENIDRHRNMGKGPMAAAYDGAREVWGAVLASTLTTIAVFLPVVYLEDEAGQLFKDIAIAVTCAVGLSLIVSITAIPMFSRQLYAWGFSKPLDAGASRKGLLGKLGGGASDVFMGLAALALRNRLTRIATIVLFVGGAVSITYFLLPKMEYLPQGNRDLIINVMVPPPGLSYDEREKIGKQLMTFLDPYMEQERDGYPRIRHSFYVGREQSMILGVSSAEQARTRELIPLCKTALAQIPGVLGISNQASVFQSGLGQGRTITVDLSGPDINALVRTGGAMFGMIREQIPDVQVRPVPSLDLLFPETNFVPDRERLRAVGMTAQQFGIGLDVLMDGREIGDFKQEGKKKIDLVLKVADTQIETPEDLYQALLATPSGEAVPVSSLARLQRTTGMTELRHLERDRTVSLQVSPPYEVTIQEAMEVVNSRVVPALKEQGLLQDIQVGMSGTADKLTETRIALQWNFVLAAAICYLLMSALLSNFIYPFIIMFTVPLASAGGLIGLKLVNRFIALQQLDILTMLGFIILIGVVVNNAILIVYQSLQNVRIAGMDYKDAVLTAVRTRLRPIYMSTTTSVFGMLPLVLWPGPGSELYRGLGAVVLGGLALSTLFTIYLIPSLLMFFIGMEKRGTDAEEGN